VRSAPLTLVATIAIAAVLPSSAFAATGWKLPTISSNVAGLKVDSGASRCGKAKFGSWRFRGTIRAEGKVAHVHWYARVTQDGAPHRLMGVRVTGTAPEAAKTAIANSLRGQRVRYLAGSTPRLETVTSSGERLSTRMFKPRRTKHC